MKELVVLSNNEGKYVEHRGVILKYEHIREEGYGEYDSFDMNPAALKGFTTVYHTFKIGDFETKYVHDISGPSSSVPLPRFFARDCENQKEFEIVEKTPYSEKVLGIVKVQ